ncbi:hypothetical protein B0H12DRAFT_1137999 [Mycena haematopus]|nr:hypothetical protein B0H12DRAFT_1137999 [Mycena haematopus]
MVSRAWASRCRIHLLKSCALHTKSAWRGRDNILSFRDLQVLQSPYCTFLPQVRTLETIRYSSDADDSHFQKITADLHRLTGVVELVMDASIDPRSATADSFFSTGFFTAFPNVTMLTLDYAFTSEQSGDLLLCLFPIIDLICLFPSLQELHVYTTVGKFANPSAAAFPPQQLRSLVL